MVFSNLTHMKKVLLSLLIAVVSMFCADDMSARHGFGVIGGATFSSARFKDISGSTMTQFHAGVTYCAKLPLGFSIQPSLIYQVKGAKANVVGLDMNASVGYLELPVSVQWGPDLIFFRPFLDVTPFVGYGLNNKFWVNDSEGVANSWDGVNRWEYGIGTGIGVDIWKFQVIARYNWNLGALSQSSNLSEISQMFKDGANFGGLTLSVAFLF